MAFGHCRQMKRRNISTTLCVAIFLISAPSILSFELRNQQAVVPGDGMAVSVHSEDISHMCSPTLPSKNRTISRDRQWMDNLLKNQRMKMKQNIGPRLVQTESRITLIQEEKKPKIKPTYKYLGCYSVKNKDTDFLKPKDPPSGMTVEKCYNFCHDAEVKNPPPAPPPPPPPSPPPSPPAGKGILSIRWAEDIGCIKSGGAKEKVIRNADDGCARFIIDGKEIKSLDHPKQCLDDFGKEGFGLWECHGKKNQQFTKEGDKWCNGGKCVEDLGNVHEGPPMNIRLAGDSGCLKSDGAKEKVIANAEDGCAGFKIEGNLFESLDHPGQCLDLYGEEGFGLWDCHGKKNQQFTMEGDKWCNGGKCVQDWYAPQPPAGSPALGPAGKVQFFLLTKGKECSCLHYIDKDQSASKELAKTCRESCEGKEAEKCGGMLTHDVYVMIDCPVLPPSKVQQIKDEQQKEILAKAKDSKKENEAKKAKKLGLSL